MAFTVYPAIDIRNGRCVRLYQGDYNQETGYGDPVEMAQRWESEGAAWLHLVDLDGAKEGLPVNNGIIKQILESVNIPVQVGGGIRKLETIEAYLALGVKRLILGTIALENPQILQEAIQLKKEAIAVGIDAKNGYVATKGWLEISETKAENLGKYLSELGVETFIYTDIAKDGTLSGPNIEAIKRFAEKTKAAVIASGGIGSLNDLQQTRNLEGIGVSGAIIGKALYTGKIVLKDLAW